MPMGICTGGETASLSLHGRSWLAFLGIHRLNAEDSNRPVRKMHGPVEAEAILGKASPKNKCRGALFTAYGGTKSADGIIAPVFGLRLVRANSVRCHSCRELLQVRPLPATSEVSSFHARCVQCRAWSGVAAYLGREHSWPSEESAVPACVRRLAVK